VQISTENSALQKETSIDEMLSSLPPLPALEVPRNRDKLRDFCDLINRGIYGKRKSEIAHISMRAHQELMTKETAILRLANEKDTGNAAKNAERYVLSMMEMMKIPEKSNVRAIIRGISKLISLSRTRAEESIK